MTEDTTTPEDTGHHCRHTHPQSRAWSYLRVLDETISAVLSNGQQADIFLGSYFRKNRQCGSADRRSISSLVYAYFRCFGWILKAGIEKDTHISAAASCAAETPDSTLLRAYATAAGIPDESIPDREDLEKLVPAERFKRMLAASGHDIETPSLRDTLPAWIDGRLESGADVSELAEDMASRPPLWLRSRKDPGKVMRSLIDEGIACSAHGVLKNALKIEKPTPALNASEAMKKGMAEIQDISSQSIGLAASPNEGETWWDPCAGGGGKSLQLADMMHGKGRVISSDVSGRRLADLAVRAKRDSLDSCIEILGEYDAALGAPEGILFDGVLVDAPCSASGRWRRNPEKRWNTSPADIEKYVSVQKTILSAVSAAVKPGGVLVYATCSVFKDEDSGVVSDFLARHPDFQLESFTNPLTDKTTEGFLLTLPADADCDASFAARFRRSGKEENASGNRRIES